MKVLITGGAGYLGCSLVNSIHEIQNIHEIIVFDNLTSSPINFFLGLSKLDKVKFVEADILNYNELEKQLNDVEVVYHLAAYTAFSKNHLDNFRYEQINLWGTNNLVNAIKGSKTVKKVIYLSSGSVYGNVENIQESDIPQPNNPYAKSKYEAEKYIQLLSNSCEVHIVRPGNIFGFNSCLRIESVINKFLFGAIIKNKIFIYGSGEQKKPFIEINNLCIFLTQLLSEKNEKKLHILADFNSSMLELKNLLLEICPNLEYQFVNSNLKFDGFSYSNSILKNNNSKKLIEDTYNVFIRNLKIINI